MAIEATDILNLGAEFSSQSSSTIVDQSTRPEVTAADGDNACVSDPKNIITRYPYNYQHCGTTNGIKTDLGVVLTTFGEVVDSKFIDTLSLAFSNAGYPVLSGSAHNHASNPHTTGNLATFNVAPAIPDGQGVGVPVTDMAALATYAITFAATSKPSSATYDIAVRNHVDDLGAEGDHFQGQNSGCRVGVSITGFGVSGDVTFGAAWFVDSNENSDSNTESDQFTVSAYTYIDKI